MIEIKNLSKSFGDLTVLKDINLEINTGEIYGLVGQSGSGKSTLLRCLNGLNTYDDGSLQIDGVEVGDFKDSEMRDFRKNIGMIFQNFSLLERINVFENVAFPLRVWNYKESEIEKKVKEMLRLVSLEEKIYAKPRELSGGQKQRVAIARALVLNPKYLLSDEATSALDPKIGNSILDLLKKVNEELGITIIIVSHQMEALKTTCDRMAILKNGVLTDKGDVKEIFLRNPKALQDLLGVEESKVSKGKIRYRLLIKEIDEKMFFYDFHKDTNISYNFISGGIERFKEGNCFLGEIEVDIQNSKLAEDYFTDKNIYYEVRYSEI